MSPHRISPSPRGPQEWSRRHLQVLLVCLLVVVAALVAGGVWSVVTLIDPGRSESLPNTLGQPIARSSTLDELATAPLPVVAAEAAQPGPLSAESTARSMTIPPPQSLGSVQVPTGFPHTSEGALAQLVAIDQRALESTSITTAQKVITEWALSGGPTGSSWSGTRAVVTLLSAVGMTADGGGELEVVLRPAMGLIKGHVGGDFVIPCVDFVATISTVRTTSGGPVRVAVADCQRMVWHEGGWRIGPGEEPAPAPSIWPGTRASYDVGYRWLEVSP